MSSFFYTQDLTTLLFVNYSRENVVQLIKFDMYIKKQKYLFNSIFFLFYPSNFDNIFFSHYKVAYQ